MTKIIIFFSSDCQDICPEVYKPVCGSNNETYSNECELEVAACKNPSEDIEKKSDGPCQENDSNFTLILLNVLF